MAVATAEQMVAYVSSTLAAAGDVAPSDTEQNSMSEASTAFEEFEALLEEVAEEEEEEEEEQEEEEEEEEEVSGGLHLLQLPLSTAA
eukprot:COSAG04_NODE_2211_length_4523_cov_5.122061_2_plen_87_part_00